MYRVDSLTLLVFEMLKFPKAKIDARFLKELDFVTNNCLAQNVSRECRRKTENLSKCIPKCEKLCAKIFLFSRIFYKAILLSELYR